MCSRDGRHAMKEQFGALAAHLEFARDVCTWQVWRGRKFLHWHPGTSASWNLQRIVELMGSRQGEGTNVLSNGSVKALVGPTMGLSDCTRTLDEVGVTCKNEGAELEERHEHVKPDKQMATSMGRFGPEVITAVLNVLDKHCEERRIDLGGFIGAGKAAPDGCNSVTWLETRGTSFCGDVTCFPLDPKLVRRQIGGDGMTHAPAWRMACG